MEQVVEEADGACIPKYWGIERMEISNIEAHLERSIAWMKGN